MDSGSDSERSDNFDTLKINENFASKYEHNAKRKLLEQGRAKYGDNFDKNIDESESSSSEDDSDAELLNPRVEQKFLEVLTAIKNDPKKLLAMDKPVFEDEDFDMEAKKKADKPMFLKDQIRQHTLKKMNKKGSDSSSDDNEADQDSEDDGADKKRRANKESGLFTKMGVT